MSIHEKLAATVVHVIDDYKVVINRGLEQDVKVGDTYLIYAIGPDLIDPETEESLGPLEEVRGRAIVRHVQPKISTLETIDFDETPGKRKIIKRDGSSIQSAILGLAQREEIEEGPERRQRPMDAKRGDLAKLLSSK